MSIGVCPKCNRHLNMGQCPVCLTGVALDESFEFDWEAYEARLADQGQLHDQRDAQEKRLLGLMNERAKRPLELSECKEVEENLRWAISGIRQADNADRLRRILTLARAELRQLQSQALSKTTYLRGVK